MGVVTEVSWSFSRQQAWRSCPRSVFYASCWRGDPELAAAPRLRLLMTPAMAAGGVVDRLVGESLRNVRAGWPIPDDLAEVGVRRLAEQIVRSPDRATALLGLRYFPADSLVLHGDFYGDPHPTEEIERALLQTREALAGFLASELLERLVRCGGRGFVLPTSRVPSFGLNGARLYAGPDFILMSKGGRALIADWKAGTPSPAAVARGWRQLGVYGLYAVRALGLDPQALYAQIVWLRESPGWEPSPITPTLLGLCEEELSKGVEEFRGRLHRDKENGSTSFIASVKNFPARAAPSVCRRCCYLRLCPEGMRATRE